MHLPKDARRFGLFVCQPASVAQAYKARAEEELGRVNERLRPGLRASSYEGGEKCFGRIRLGASRLEEYNWASYITFTRGFRGGP